MIFALDRMLMRSYFSLETHGIERIPAQGPWVMTPNHVSLLDAPALIAVFPPRWLPRTCWGGWTGIMFRSPLMRLVSRATRVLPVEQTGRPLVNLALGAAALARGDNLVWFPEGDRSPDGTLKTFQPGIGLILTAHPVPVIPVRLEGTFEALPRGARWPRRRRIRILFGAPLAPGTLAGPSQGPDRYREMAAALYDHVAALGAPSDQTPMRTNPGLTSQPPDPRS
jgi:long-chain acyl-CoA synthetase